MTKQQHHTDGVDDLTGVDREKVQQLMRLLLEAVGEDPEQEGLKEMWQCRVLAALEITEDEPESMKPTTTQATVGELINNEQRRFRSAVDSYE